MSVLKPVLHLEVVQRLHSCMDPNELSKIITDELQLLGQSELISTRSSINVIDCSNESIKEHVESISVCELNNVDIVMNVGVKDVEVRCHVYRLNPDGAQIEMMENESEESLLSAASHWILPSRDLHGLWDSLVYDSEIKDNLLSFVETTLLFSDRSVDSNIIGWNRVVLLHGPPGTGKTSLCKALAQKLSIRLCNDERFTHGELIEINSHSLFSKWFSESGKLVMKMFCKIHELIDDPRALVCVLIDEVESLTHARQSAMTGAEPSDSIRVVNAVLTQIDQLRRFPNVLILTTSNLTGAIDLAFVDRADIKQYIGPPNARAIYQIYYSCINELIKKNIVTITEHSFLLDLNTLQTETMDPTSRADGETSPSFALFRIARKSEGLSGRTLRKIPFLAHAHYVKRPTVALETFLDAMEQAVAKQMLDREPFESS